jgi:hypothetical protein
MTRNVFVTTLTCVVFTGLSTNSFSAPAPKADPLAGKQVRSVKTDTLTKKQIISPSNDSLAKEQGGAKEIDTLAQNQVSVPAADAAASPHFGRLAIVTTPADAEVSLDSVMKGHGPLTLDSLMPGLHTLIVKAPGYFGKKVSMDVPADSTVNVSVALVLPARLVVISTPAGAATFLDGKELGVTPCDNSRVKPGKHTLKLDKAGYVPLEKAVSLSEGAADTLSLVLQPLASTAVPQKPIPAPAKGFDKIAALVAVGAFVLFGVVVLVVELNEASH